MGKKIRNYSIFVLFLLMSMSVFAGWGNGNNGNTTTITTGTEVIDGINVTYKVTIIEGNGVGNTTTFSKLNFQNYTNDSRGINITLMDNGHNNIYKFQETINGKKNPFTLNYDKTTGGRGNAKTLTLDYVSSYKIDLGASVQISFYVGTGGLNGNGEKVTIEYTEPSFLEIKTYEEYKNDGVIEDLVDGGETYKFTKGGSGSYVKKPSIYVTIPETYSNGNQIIAFEIEKFDEYGSVIASEIFDISEISDDIEIKNIDGYKFTEGTNTVKVTTIIEKNEESGNNGKGSNNWSTNETNGTQTRTRGKNGTISTTEEYGESTTLNFVVDTQINDIYLGGGIIGDLTSIKDLDEDTNYLMNDEEITGLDTEELNELKLNNVKVIVVDLSALKELSGIAGYSYTLEVGDEEKSDGGNGINTNSFITVKEDSTDKSIIINPSTLIAGSKGTLLFTVYDKLGHERTFEKTYFIPTKPTGIISKIEGEVKQRNSRIKIVTEGNKDKFGISNSSDGSSE